MSRKKNNGSAVKTVLIVLIVLMIAASGLLLWLSINLVNQAPAPAAPKPPAATLPVSTQAPAEPTETTEPQPEPQTVVSTATVGTMGDILMHIGVVNSGRQSDGSYNYDNIFQYVKEFLEPLDYAIANLETTLGGSQNPYQGAPAFNSPDSIADAAKAAGYDMLLTGNNHCSDTRTDGILRTLEQVRQRGMATLGTQMSADEPNYEIVDVNGIKIGMVCYTYATSVDSKGLPRMNKNAAVTKPGLVNFFTTGNLNKFYNEIQATLEEMKQAGAETTMVFLHWGKEYELEAVDSQVKMAQKLCDLGVDVIVGGHPHVVEPMALIESTVDPSHKTVCIYSVGNAVSNQRTGGESRFPDGYIEDGVVFTVTFEKLSNGEVNVLDTDVLPTWVNRHSDNGAREYNIIPLDTEREDAWQELYQVSDTTLPALRASYDRTMGLVGEGLQACKDYLAQAKAERDTYYQIPTT